jgi:predicted aconitase
MHTRPEWIITVTQTRKKCENNCALLGYYAANSGNFLPAFRDNLLVSSARVKKLYFAVEA